ncbi:hypothetical protein LTS15_010049 [Exophiala xenobiotica]|nr:hypothetical protein LTS15_010049 [Exophiala xenobiotica]
MTGAQSGREPYGSRGLEAAIGGGAGIGSSSGLGQDLSSGRGDTIAGTIGEREPYSSRVPEGLEGMTGGDDTATETKTHQHPFTSSGLSTAHDATIIAPSRYSPELTRPEQDLYNLMPPPRRQQLHEQRQRTASIKSTLSDRSITESTTSEFLEKQLELVQSEFKYQRLIYDGLAEVESETAEQKQQSLKQTWEAMKPLGRELKELKRRWRGITQDFDDEIKVQKRRAPVESGLTMEDMEQAYLNTIVARVMAASANQCKKPFNQGRFRTRVLDYYGVLGDPVTPESPKEEIQQVWCSLIGEYFDAPKVKAAHLVPKCLKEEELITLFGSDEKEAIKSPRNGLPLYTTVEQALDEGDIVIVPIPTDDGPTRWKCLLVNENKRKLTCYLRSSGKSKPDKHLWADYDGKELQFLNDNRPARRFLYFRFIITFLNSRNFGNFDFSNSVEAQRNFWASPGQYLRKSTLIVLARNISGLRLPTSIYGTTTFEDDTMKQDEQEEANLLLALRVSDVMKAGEGSEKARVDSDDETDED